MSCRIAFLNFSSAHIAGVDGAIRGMSDGARASGVPIDVMVLVPDTSTTEDASIRRVPYPTWRRVRRAQNLFRYRAIANANIERYDVVFLRYPMSVDLDPLALFRRRFFDKIATVHHTNELRELWASKHTPGIAARVAFEWAGGRRLLSRVDGIVGVTDEIRAFELERMGRKSAATKPSAAISNGVSVDKVPFTRFVPFDGRTLRLVMVASSVAPWHGWDRLTRALEAHRGKVRIVIDAVGHFGRQAGSIERLHDNEIRYHGLLHGPALTKILEEANVGVSSLAMHRNGLSQGCVLKTREYTARGLPFIYGYEDMDLRPEDPFCLRMPISDAPLEIDRIVDFAERVARSPEDVSDVARRTATERMDWSVKMRQFHDFGRRLLA